MPSKALIHRKHDKSKKKEHFIQIRYMEKAYFCIRLGQEFLGRTESGTNADRHNGRKPTDVSGKPWKARKTEVP